MASSGCTDFVRPIGEVIGLDVLLTKDARHRGFLCEDGHYRVLLHGGWINVPNSSVVTEPNRYGPAVVSTYMDSNGSIYIRCFFCPVGRHFCWQWGRAERWDFFPEAARRRM